MKFLKQPAEKAIDTITNVISNALKSGKTVLWLVCGGSNIATQVSIMARLQDNCADFTQNLIILPMDERYGAEGHPDSNYFQMRQTGFIPGDASWTDVLAQNLPLTKTVSYYSELVEQAFAKADFIIGTFGMGADGHTAGVLPHSPALSAAEPVAGYEAPGFVRMTMTPDWLKRCDVSFVLAYGAEKAPALSNLQENVLPLEDMPVGLHYAIPSATIYNDHIGDEVTQ